MPTALLIGGTGPTGPFIVDGLLARGWSVTVLHSGRRSAPYSGAVETLHADPNFAEALVPALAGRRWDLVIASYGRLRGLVEVLKGHTNRLLAITGATGGTARDEDARWGALGRPALLDEVRVLSATGEGESTLALRIAQAEAALFEAHAQGHFSVTCIAYPILYGPRQPGATDWAIVRRVLDGRRQFILADGGHKLESRAYAENAAHAVLLAIDQPEASHGRRYLVADQALHSLRQRVEAVAAHLGHRFELVDMPYDWARPCHPLWRHTRESRVIDSGRIRRELAYVDPVAAPEALARSVDWMVAQRGAMAEVEAQLGDPFDYAREDALIAAWQQAQPCPVNYPLAQPRHIYRHPTPLGEVHKLGEEHNAAQPLRTGIEK